MPPVDQMRPGERRRFSSSSSLSSSSFSSSSPPSPPPSPWPASTSTECRPEWPPFTCYSSRGHPFNQSPIGGGQVENEFRVYSSNYYLQQRQGQHSSKDRRGPCAPSSSSPPPKCRSRTSKGASLILPAGAGARVRRMMMMSSKICRLRATSALLHCASASYTKLLLVLLLLFSITGPGKGLKITPKPCTNALGEEGTCMFVWECIKTDGKHLGTCVDGILFGSCCGHNETANEITSSWVSMSPSTSSGDSSTSSQWTEYQPFHPSSPSVAQFSSPPTPSSASSPSSSSASSPSSSSSSSFTSIHVVTGSSPSFPGSVSSWPGNTHHSSHHNPPTSSSIFPSASSPISSSPSSSPSSPSSSSSSSPFTSSSPFDPFGSSYDPHLSFTSSSTTTTTSTTESPFSYSTSPSSLSTSSSGSFGSPPYQYPPSSQPVDTFGPVNSQYPPSVNYPPSNANGGQSSPGEQQQHLQQQVNHQTPASQQQQQHQHQHQQQLYPTSGSQQQPQKPWQPVSSLNQSPPNGPINVIGPVKWPSNNGQTQVPTTSTTASPPVTVMHHPYHRPPIFSIFGTHRPPVGSVFVKPPRPTRPPFHRPPFNPNRPTAISLFSPFSTRPTVTPIYPGASSSHYPVVTSPSRPAASSTTSSTSTTTTSTTTPAPEYPIHSWPTPHRPGGYPGASVTSDSNNIITSSNNNGITDIPFTTHPSNDATASSSSSSPSSSSFSTSPSLPLLVTKKPVPIAKVECGTPPLLPQTKVVGGKNAAFGSWPWQVSVRRTSFFGFSSNHRCGGAIINNQWIATAGHCVDDLLLSQIRIRVGEYDFSSAMEPLPFVERGAKKKVVHPHYNFFTYENDLALVQLDEPIEFQPHISPICLPPESVDLVGRNATVTGWGRLSEGGILPSVLQEVKVPIVSNDKCKGMFLSAGRHEYIPEIFMCAGYPEGGRDSCQGDSGGPLQVQGDDGKWFLAGIISWGIGCAEPNLPGVCTRISKFKNWIVSTVS